MMPTFQQPGAQRSSGAARVPSAEAGTVLIVVLWVCLGLVSLTLVFGHSMMMAFRGTDDLIAGRQAEAAIDGAARYAGYLLASASVPGQLPLPETYLREEVPVGEARFWFLGRPFTLQGATEPVFRLIDEASKLNLNTATLEMIEGLPGMTAELAAAIIDWRDEDDEVTAGGAESETYQLRNPSYTCKNAPFETVEELALVNGASWHILLGGDVNRNGTLDSLEVSAQSVPGLLEYVTVHSREPNVREDGSPRLNVTQSTELRAYFEEVFGETRANDIMQQTAGGEQVRSLLEYFVRSGMTADEFDMVAGDLTVSDEPMIEGLVNVNTASATVLACVPGIDEEQAEQLVATRSHHAAPPSSAAWAVEILGQEGAIEAGPHLTAQTWVVGADVAAVGRHGRGYRRRYTVIDATGEIPEIVYQRNLSGLGWALGNRVFEELRLRAQRQ
jgi:DNA uptake protein ComE-like DNA-binding protein